MFGFKRKQTQSQKEIEKYHDLYLTMYKKHIDLLNTTQYAPVKNQCIMQCRNIKAIWTKKFNFDISELETLDPIGIKI